MTPDHDDENPNVAAHPTIPANRTRIGDTIRHHLMAADQFGMWDVKVSNSYTSTSPGSAGQQWVFWSLADDHTVHGQVLLSPDSPVELVCRADTPTI